MQYPVTKSYPTSLYTLSPSNPTFHVGIKSTYPSLHSRWYPMRHKTIICSWAASILGLRFSVHFLQIVSTQPNAMQYTMKCHAITGLSDIHSVRYTCLYMTCSVHNSQNEIHTDKGLSSAYRPYGRFTIILGYCATLTNILVKIGSHAHVACPCILAKIPRTRVNYLCGLTLLYSPHGLNQYSSCDIHGLSGHHTAVSCAHGLASSNTRPC